MAYNSGNVERCEAGGFRCPKCGAAMRPMIGRASGKGWNCTKGVWRNGRTEGCDGVIWNKANTFVKREVIRAATWANIPNRTEQQLTLRAALAVKPNGNRCKIIDASAGTAKTTSMADDMEVISKRDSVVNWHCNAFNVNARISLEAKTPAEWPNISTINGFGGTLQGYNFRQYKTAKINAIFKECISHLPPKERPSAAGVKAFAERMRDMLLYRENAPVAWWNAAIDAVASRFGALGKMLAKPGTEQTIREYLPIVLEKAMADGRTIDLCEQYSRPALEAIRRTGWEMNLDAVSRRYEWTDGDIRHLANLIREIRVSQVSGVIVDEAQDLSLSQICLYLACTYRAGELILVGDDCLKTPEGELIKAGQAIFGWRGAFPGSLTLIARLWKELTGEETERFPLSVSFRCPPEICAAVRSLNKTITASKPVGSGESFAVNAEQAYTRWVDLADGERALWLFRRNAPQGPIFMRTLRDRKQVCLRGGGDMATAIDSALYSAAGYYDDAGEYRVSLRVCLDKLRAEASENDQPDADSMEEFLITVGEEINRDPSILREADLKPDATVGNLRRFILHYASKDAPRVLSTVYRAKGDEAELVIVDDTEQFNTPWNGDEDEAAACRFVAATRTKRTLLVVGALAGVEIGAAPDQPALPVVVAPVKPAKPRKARKSIGPVDLFGE